MSKHNVVVHLQSIVVNGLNAAEFKSIKEGNGLAENETLKKIILELVENNLNMGNGVEYAEEL